MILKRLLVHASKTNSWRTLFSKINLFIPVSKSRWDKAQISEQEAWELPAEWDYSVDHPSFTNEETKSGHLIAALEKQLDIQIAQEFSGRSVIDIGCGPCSFVSKIQTPAQKFGVDPFPFPRWVLDRYAELNFKVLPFPLEVLESPDQVGPNPVIIMYNALQHFWSPSKAFKRIHQLFPQHEILIVEYLNTSADNAHPQIITKQRIERLLKRNSYSNIVVKSFDTILAPLIQYGEGIPAHIGVARAELNKL